MTDHTPVALLQQMNMKVPPNDILHFYVTSFTCMLVCLSGTKGHFMVQHGGSLRCQSQRLREVSKYYFSPVITKHESTTDKFYHGLMHNL